MELLLHPPPAVDDQSGQSDQPAPNQQNRGGLGDGDDIVIVMDTVLIVLVAVIAAVLTVMVAVIAAVLTVMVAVIAAALTVMVTVICTNEGWCGPHDPQYDKN